MSEANKTILSMHNLVLKGSSNHAHGWLRIFSSDTCTGFSEFNLKTTLFKLPGHN